MRLYSSEALEGGLGHKRAQIQVAAGGSVEAATSLALFLFSLGGGDSGGSCGHTNAGMPGREFVPGPPTPYCENQSHHQSE